MRSSQSFSVTWIRVADVCPKKRSRSSGVVVDTGQTHPRGQSRGNQNIGACRVSTAQTSGGSPGSVAAGRGRDRGLNRPRDASSLKCHRANDSSPAYGGAGSRASRASGYSGSVNGSLQARHGRYPGLRLAHLS